MPYTIQYNPEMHIIEIKVKGLVNRDELRNIYFQGVQLAKEKECSRFLNDFRDTNIQMSTMDLYELPVILSEICDSLGMQADRLWRALVIGPEYTRDATFAEDVTVNRGQHARFFHNIEEAREWLLNH